MTAVIEARGLRVAVANRERAGWFGRAPALEILHGVDLSVAEGEALGLVGESGSGKTTLGRALVRLIRPSAGSLHFQGNDIGQIGEFELRPLRAKMQMIFQDPYSSLNPRLTIGTTLKRSLTAFNRVPERGERLQRAEEVLEIVGLPGNFTSRYPHQLSGGQRQRVGIARAIALKPDFIVADEIVSGLDVSTQAQILLLLRDLQKRLKLTMVFISHDLSVVRVLCNKVVVLRDGNVVESGDCASVFASPRHPYTRELIEAIPLPDMKQIWWSAA